MLNQKKVKSSLIKWVENHPDVWHNDHFWYVQNAIGDILGWPDWYSEFITELYETVKK